MEQKQSMVILNILMLVKHEITLKYYYYNIGGGGSKLFNAVFVIYDIVVEKILIISTLCLEGH